PRREGGLGRFGRLVGRHVLPNIWDKLGPVLLRRPGVIWSATVIVLAPFAVIALLRYHDQIYNPLSGLPPDAPSTAATRTLEQHFPAGITGPVVILLKNA